MTIGGAEADIKSRIRHLRAPPVMAGLVGYASLNVSSPNPRRRKKEYRQRLVKMLAQIRAWSVAK